MTSAIGRLVTDVWTNKSGGAIAYGDVGINDGSNAHAFTTTTTSGFTAGVVGVCIEPNGIANNASGRMQTQGYCAQVNTNASVTNGYFLKTHTVAKQAAGSATRVVGSFGVAMSTATNPAAMLWGLPDASSATGNVAADAIWDAAGDLAVGTGADTAAKLTIGAAGGALSVINSAVAWNSGTSMPGSKATGDRYWRTDLGLEAYWDGTRWLSTTLFTVSFPPTQAVNTFTTATNMGRLPIPYKGTYSVYMDSWDWFLVAGGTYSGSVYWTCKINWADVNDSDTQVGSTTLDSKTDTGGTSHNYTHNGSLATVLSASAVEIKARIDPVGGAAGLTFSSATLNYRLILT